MTKAHAAGCIRLHGLFLCAMADADSIEDAVAEDAESGIASVTVEGETVTMADPMKRLDVADRLRRTNAAAQPHFGLRNTRLIGPGAWD